MSLIRHIALSPDPKRSFLRTTSGRGTASILTLNGTFAAIDGDPEQISIATWDEIGLTIDNSTTSGVAGDALGANLTALKNGNFLVVYDDTVSPTHNLVLYDPALNIIASRRIEGITLGSTNLSRRKIAVDVEGNVYLAKFLTGNTVETYLDGEPVSLVNGLNQNFNNVVNFDQEMAIGGVNASSTPVFLVNGNLADMRFWSRYKTNSQIVASKDKQLAGTEEGLFAYFKFDEGTGAIIADSAGANNGSLTGNVGDNMWSSDVPFVGANFSLSLNGTDQYGLASMNAWGAALNEFTFECWFKTVSTSVMTPAGVRNAGTSMVFQPHLNRDETSSNIQGVNSLFLRDHSGNDRQRAYSAAETIADGGWHHLAWTKANINNENIVMKLSPTDLSTIWEAAAPDTGLESYIDSGMFLESIFINSSKDSDVTVTQFSTADGSIVQQQDHTIPIKGRYLAATPLANDQCAVVAQRGTAAGAQDILILDNTLSVLKTVNSFGSLGTVQIPSNAFIESTINNDIVFNVENAANNRMIHFNWNTVTLIENIDLGTIGTRPNSLSVDNRELALFGIGLGATTDSRRIWIWDLDAGVRVTEVINNILRSRSHWTNWQLLFFRDFYD